MTCWTFQASRTQAPEPKCEVGKKVPPAGNLFAKAAFTGKIGRPDKGSVRLEICARRTDRGLEHGRMRIMKNSTTAGGVRQGTAGDPLGPNSEIGRKLKQYYDELVSDEVPDRFAQLLAQLEKTEPAHKKD
jgi:hypothetical protein